MNCHGHSITIDRFDLIFNGEYNIIHIPTRRFFRMAGRRDVDLRVRQGNYAGHKTPAEVPPFLCRIICRRDVVIEGEDVVPVVPILRPAGGMLEAERLQARQAALSGRAPSDISTYRARWPASGNAGRNTVAAPAQGTWILFTEPLGRWTVRSQVSMCPAPGSAPPSAGTCGSLRRCSAVAVLSVAARGSRPGHG
jgi:hypothetical protein